MIDFIEFLEMMAKMSTDVDETIKEAFYIFDSDGSGKDDTKTILSEIWTFLSPCYSYIMLYFYQN